MAADPSPSGLRPAAQRVQALLRAAGLSGDVVEFAETTRTSVEAAAAIGCDVAQIAKSLIFRARPSDRPVLVIASGRNRVNEKRVVERLAANGQGEGLARADADFVREKTGFAIGGVAPIGHDTPPIVFIDRDLLGFAEIWAAAGTPFAVFKLTPDELVRLTGGEVVTVL
jgi:prolyl-tRNA editing enzyme YbaK/EbsC (Cys-tRNA(Pro) deacylase)